MTKIMIRIHNVETGKIIDREMNDAEITAHEADAAALGALETARQAILDRLGITAEEAQLILGGSN